MHLFIEKGIRVGISYISKRYPTSDDKNCIMNWDANNLYGWTMCNKLPARAFKFLNKKETDTFVLNSISKDSETGYILDCDLEYCKELHVLHNDYPLCPEKIEVS